MDFRKQAKESRAKKLHQMTVSGKDAKVDSSDFTPYADPNMDKKTGKRPLNPRNYKRGGKVAALDGAKAAKRGDRMGAKGRKAKQVGGGSLGSGPSEDERAKLKSMAEEASKSQPSSQKIKAATENMYKDAQTPLPSRRPEEAPKFRAKEDIQSPYKKGGRTKKALGGDITSGGNPQIPSGKGQTSLLRKAVGLDYEKGGKVKKMNGGPMMAGPTQNLMKRKTPLNNPAAKAPMVMPTRAKGGKVSHMEWEHSKEDLAQDKKLAKKHGMSLEKWEESKLDEKHDKQQSTKGLKRGGRACKDSEKYETDKEEAAENEMKCGGRAQRASGGRARGKSNINIVIAPQPAAQGPAGMPPRPMMPPPPPMGGMPPMGMPPGGMPPGAMPPMPMGGGMPPMPPMGGAPMPMPPGVPSGMPGMAPLPRKSGGRVKSFKDMTAGAGSGVGRLQKEDMQEYKRLGRKSGGKVQSYQDMTAGAGSGEGRLQKTELQENKRTRVKKQFGGGMGGFGAAPFQPMQTGLQQNMNNDAMAANAMASQVYAQQTPPQYNSSFGVFDAPMQQAPAYDPTISGIGSAVQPAYDPYANSYPMGDAMVFPRPLPALSDVVQQRPLYPQPAFTPVDFDRNQQTDFNSPQRDPGYGNAPYPAGFTPPPSTLDLNERPPLLPPSPRPPVGVAAPKVATTATPRPIATKTPAAPAPKRVPTRKAPVAPVRKLKRP